MGFWGSIFEILLILFFVLLNGFFVAAEFAIVKVRSTQIEMLVQKGNLRANIAKDIVAHLDAYLSATQLGITMASLALGWIGEPFIAQALRGYFVGWGMTNPQLIQAVSFGIAFSIITFLHIVLGELAPKSLAIQKTRATTLWIAYPLKLFFVLFKPIISALNWLANGILHIVGIQPVTGTELLHSEEELRLLLAQDPNVSGESKNIVLRAMDFRRKQARHAMVPRTEIVGLSLADAIEANLETMRSHKYSRYPVYKETLDNIVGIVHTKDIFKQDPHLQPTFTLDAIIRDATFLPETAGLEKVLQTMLQKKAHMIMLADEYGGTAGIITLENVMEELVGTIQDEFDRELPEITKISDDEYLVDAGMTTNEVERLLNCELSTKDIRSIGAYVIEQLGHVPKKGESIRVNGTEFTVDQVDERAIERIRIKRLPKTGVEEGKAEDEE